MHEWTWTDDRQAALSRIVRTGPKWYERTLGPTQRTVTLETRTANHFGNTQRMGDVTVHYVGGIVVGLSMRVEDGYAVD